MLERSLADGLPVADTFDDPEDGLALQLALAHLGYPPPPAGEIDGDVRGALEEFRRGEGLEPRGRLDRATVKRIRNALLARATRRAHLPVVFVGPGDAEPDAGTPCVVDDPKALVRTPPPGLSSTGEKLAMGSRVQVLEWCDSGGRRYARVRPPGTPAEGEGVWTAGSNLASGLEFDDAVVPDRTLDETGLSGVRRRMARIYNEKGGYLARKSGELQIPLPMAVAVLAVEAGGRGFTPDHWPKIRFENHVFRSYFVGRGPDGEQRKEVFATHFRFDSDKRWKGHRFRPSADADWRGFHGNQAAEREVQRFASTLDPYAALCSASYGAAQVMGFNHLKCGYDDVGAMVDAFRGAIVAHLDALFAFITGTSRCMNGLRAGDATEFARGYNGSGQAEHYGNVIQEHADALEALLPSGAPIPSAVPPAAEAPTAEAPAEEAPAAVAPETPPTPAEPPPAPADWVEELRRVAVFLGRVDGDFGPLTEGATRAFQTREGLVVDGIVGPRTFASAVGFDRGEIRTLRRGNRGEGVRRWQTYLGDQRLLDDSDDEAAVRAAVRAFQVQQGLTVDGIVGPRTLARLAEVVPRIDG